MRLAAFPGYVSGAGQEIYRSFLESTGQQIVTNDLDADVAVIWSVLWSGRMQKNREVFQHYRKQNKPVIVLETGVIKRNETYKISVNGTDSTASYWPRDTWQSDRHHRMLAHLTPSRKGDKILICAQNPFSHNWPKHMTMESWVENTIDTLRQYTDRSIEIRQHPRYTLGIRKDLWDLEVKPKFTVLDDTDLVNVFDDCWAVVNHNSYPGIQSRLHGVNAVVDFTSLATRVSWWDLKDIEKQLPSPDEDWLQFISHTEFADDEIRNGDAWRAIRPLLDA